MIKQFLTAAQNRITIGESPETRVRLTLISQLHGAPKSNQNRLRFIHCYFVYF